MISMRQTPSTLAFLAAACLSNFVLAQTPAKDAARKIQVLIVTGDDVPAHNWRETTPVDREILEQDSRFEVRVSEEIGVLESDALRRYDLVILAFRNNPERRDLSPAGRKSLIDFVEGGGGLVAVHFAAAAFGNWPEYQALIGRYWKPRESGHGPRGPFRVEVADKEHAATQGLGEGFEIDDELYAKLAEASPSKVLVQAKSEWSGKVEPLAWTLERGKGRVFGLALGHDAKARRHPAYGKLLAQGAAWASRK